MIDLLTKLYYGQIDIANKKPPIKRSEKEYNLYEELRKSLAKEQFETFEEFLTLYTYRYSDYQEFVFKQGVKLGFELAEELKHI
ncbi:MAG: hypothetical protein E7348_03060 [Clostridiales bacterium]|nr:hypothetical protein [Clostridiales bacterium]